MIGKCDICKKFKFSLKKHNIMDGPGSGRIYEICNTCTKEGKIPKSFNEKMGITEFRTPDAEFVKFIGSPQITESRYGSNAFGSVLALYDDNSRIPVICMHGGSAWLCYECAVKLIKKE